MTRKGDFKRFIPAVLREGTDRRGPNDCWHWTGFVLPNGYGRLHAEGKKRYAHICAYEQINGPVPAGYEIDHLCHTTDCRLTNRECLHRRCVNPAHLAATTHRDNTNRTNSPSAINARRTHCKYGHEFNEENTYWNRDSRRTCKACNRDNARARYKPVIHPRPPRKPKRLKTHCINGHALVPENIYTSPQGIRSCRTCRRAYDIAAKARKAARRAA